jgi:hypothetical protein
LSIGAVFFGPGGLGKEFYQTVTLDSCMEAGLTVSGSNFKWWMAQPGPARKALFDEPRPLTSVLEAFTNWAIYTYTTGADAKVWGNGSDFDNAILAHAYAKLGMETPWKFWNSRCYRTTCDLLSAQQRKQEGVHHNALDDAKSQAKHLVELLTARAVW